MSFRIVALPEFEKELKKLGKKYRSIRDDYAHLLDLLDRNPSLGTPLGKNAFKIRMAIGSNRGVKVVEQG